MKCRKRFLLLQCSHSILSQFMLSVIGPSKNIMQKPYDTATEFIQKKYSSLKQQQHKLYLHDYISYSIAKTLR